MESTNAPDTSVSQYRCNHCNKVFSGNSALSRHQREKKTYKAATKCLFPACSKAYKRPGATYKHFTLVHSQTLVSAYEHKLRLEKGAVEALPQQERLQSCDEVVSIKNPQPTEHQPPAEPEHFKTICSSLPSLDMDSGDHGYQEWQHMQTIDGRKPQKSNSKVVDSTKVGSSSKYEPPLPLFNYNNSINTPTGSPVISYPVSADHIHDHNEEATQRMEVPSYFEEAMYFPSASVEEPR